MDGFLDGAFVLRARSISTKRMLGRFPDKQCRLFYAHEEMFSKEPIILLPLLLLVCLSLPCSNALHDDSIRVVANSTGFSWKNSAWNASFYQGTFSGGLSMLLIATSPAFYPAVACGFYCLSDGYQCLFSIFAYKPRGEVSIPEWDFSPKVIWSANRNRLVGTNATLELGADGNLVLRDSDGTLVWSTNTSGKGVVRMSLDYPGNLMLLNAANKVVWQSFDRPTDVMVLGQKLTAGTSLVSSNSSGFGEGDFSLTFHDHNLGLYASGSVRYWQAITIRDEPFAEYRNNGLAGSFFPSDTQSFHFLQLESDGNVHIYAFLNTSWDVVYDFYKESNAGCGPGTCGKYGFCVEGQCSCLQLSSALGSRPEDSFIPEDSTRPQLGCRRSIPLLASQAQHMVEVNDVSSFGLEALDGTANTTEECKQACLENSSCNVAFYGFYGGYGDTCYGFDDVYTMIQSRIHLTSPLTSRYKVLIKMQTVSPSLAPVVPWSPYPAPAKAQRRKLPFVVGGIVLSAVLMVSAAGYGPIRWTLQRRRASEGGMTLESLAGLPVHFSYRDLHSCTDNFRKELGQGGFGTVFLGKLPDETYVAVKRLESARQGEQQFHAEVRTIGSIHHFNLVHLRGFCAEGEHRLLVYDYLANGSLEKWLFPDNLGLLLPWETRVRIALGIAQGLAYLHDECQERIIHLDIKPQNILLDEHFVAKVSDFGLSKLMGRDQSRVVTTMRGTPGYLAPEWLHSTITEKADVYSFGILLLEIVSGRKCIDHESEDPRKAYLPAWVYRQVVAGNLAEVIDSRLNGDFDCEQAKRIVNVALWCIQEEADARPSMTTAVEMLKGLLGASGPPPVHSNRLSRVFCPSSMES